MESQLGKRPALGLSSRNGVKRRRTWADKVVERQSANGIEDDLHRVAQRQKQIDLGKDTLAYDCFVNAVSREDRKPQHPMTPLASQRCSRRSFVGQIKRWRKMLFDFKANVDSVEASKSGGGKAESSPEPGKRSFGASQEVLGDGSPTRPKVLVQGMAAPTVPSIGTEYASPPNTSTHVSSDADTPLCADDLSDYDDDDGVILDDMGNLISMKPAGNVNSASQCLIEPSVESSSEPA